MTRVCLVGSDGVDLRRDLLEYGTAREVLAAYDIEAPYANTVCVETISLGAAVSLLNDLNWYLVRLVDAALVREPSVSDAEWLSRDLATAIRNEAVDPDETGQYLKVYGVDRFPREDDDGERDDGAEGDGDGGSRPPELTEPMFVRRTGGEIPEYDLHDVDDTLVVRVTAAEFGG